MKSTLIFCFVVILTSCAIFDKYDDNRHSWYHKSLTKEELQKLETEDYIFKDWSGKNSNGDFSIGRLVVLNTGTKKHFDFIPTGTWTEKHSCSGAKGWSATVTDSTVYDATGNILFKERYMDETNDDKVAYLLEKWTSSLTDSLRQEITEYYPNGQIKLFEQCTVVDRLRVQSDDEKEKRITVLETFLMNGRKCEPSELVHDQWYEPGVWMSKR